MKYLVTLHPTVISYPEGVEILEPSKTITVYAESLDVRPAYDVDYLHLLNAKKQTVFCAAMHTVMYVIQEQNLPTVKVLPINDDKNEVGDDGKFDTPED